MKLHNTFKKVVATLLCLSAFIFIKATAQDTNKLVVMDVVNNNPGQPIPYSKFSSPATLKSYGYGAKVTVGDDAPQFGINWSTYDPTVLPVGSAARTWIDKRAAQLQTEYTGIKAGGVKLYCQMDMLVFPTALITKYKSQMCNASGKIDISKPYTQQAVRYLMAQIFSTFPQIDGLVIRTGENYLYGEPYHTGNTLIVNNIYSDHITFLKILRDEICVQRNKDLFYRTWDFGQFHSVKKYYLGITDSIPPHPHLYFSIKHTVVDFWRDGIPDPTLDYSQWYSYWAWEADFHGVYFNPCLGIGKHKQIVEVQCQREYEGKGSNVDYISKGVIDGFQELNKPGLPKLNSLNSFKNDPHFAGVWTWSHGGGWGGPYTNDELWCELNAYVIAQWAVNPAKSESDIFTQFAQMKGLPAAQIPAFHQLCLMSDTGVLKGQYSAMGVANVEWTRDDNFGALSTVKPYLDQVIQNNQVGAYIQEKQEAANTWAKIQSLSNQLTFRDDSTTSFVRVSCAYGMYKYRLFNDAWIIMLRGYYGDKTGIVDQVQLQKAVNDYDQTWINWQALPKAYPNCPSLYAVGGFTETLEAYRNKQYPERVISYGPVVNGKTVDLGWTTSNPFNTSFIIQNSVDGQKTWKNFATATGADTTSQSNMYHTTFGSPDTGRYYFRILQYDAKGTLITSPPVNIHLRANAALAQFNAQASGQTVKMNWSTSSEFFNPGFEISKSIDNKNWGVLQGFDGAGTSSSLLNYSGLDNSPIVGYNYYKLLYYTNGVVTTSKVDTVQIAAPNALISTDADGLTFNVYPNPVQSAINFQLKGYTGKNITAVVTDHYGKEMQRENLNVTSAEKYILKDKPKPGLYILNVTGEGLSKSAKLVIQ